MGYTGAALMNEDYTVEALKHCSCTGPALKFLYNPGVWRWPQKLRVKVLGNKGVWHARSP